MLAIEAGRQKVTIVSYFEIDGIVKVFAIHTFKFPSVGKKLLNAYYFI